MSHRKEGTMADDTKKLEAKEDTKPVEIVKHETLIEALCYAMMEYKPLEKNQVVDFQTKDGRRVNYSYADLAHIRKMTDPALNRHGLVVTGKLEKRDKEEYLVTIMEHAFSEDIRTTEIEVTERSGDMKLLAANITYGNRYGFQLITGRVGEDDTDERDVQRRSDSEPERQPQPPSKTLGQLKGEYHELYKDKGVFVDDDERHAFQGIVIKDKPSSNQWKAKADFEKAIDLLMWRISIGKEADPLLDYFLNKASDQTQVQFLRVMEISRLTDLTEIEGWKIAMAAGKLRADHQIDEAILMGQALLRTEPFYQDFFEAFKEVAGVEQMSKMTKEQVQGWETTFKGAVEKYTTEHEKVSMDIEALIKGKEKTLV